MLEWELEVMTIVMLASLVTTFIMGFLIGKGK